MSGRVVLFTSGPQAAAAVSVVCVAAQHPPALRIHNEGGQMRCHNLKTFYVSQTVIMTYFQMSFYYRTLHIYQGIYDDNDYFANCHYMRFQAISNSVVNVIG